jgi:hypothetical protein
VAIVDIRMPPTQTDEGAQAAEEIRAEQPEVASCSSPRWSSHGTR